MTSSKLSAAVAPPPPPPPSPQSHYQPLPPDAHSQPPQQPQYIILLPRYYSLHSFDNEKLIKRLLCLLAVLFLGLAIFFFWPSPPELSVVRLRLDHFRVHTFPRISIFMTLHFTVNIRNRDFFSVYYESLVVSIRYRGKPLGFVTSDHGHLKARGSSYVNATLQLEGVGIFTDVISLIDDLAKGAVTFDTVTEVGGQLGLIWFEIPLQTKLSCQININTHSRTIARQNCYPEGMDSDAPSSRQAAPQLALTTPILPVYSIEFYDE